MQEFIKHIREDGTVEFRSPLYDSIVASPLSVSEPLILPSEVIAEYEATKYKQARANEYPPIGDQLDALWKGGQAAQDMLAKIQAIKQQYPKPTGGSQ